MERHSKFMFQTTNQINFIIPEKKKTSNPSSNPTDLAPEKSTDELSFFFAPEFPSSTRPIHQLLG